MLEHLKSQAHGDKKGKQRIDPKKPEEHEPDIQGCLKSLDSKIAEVFRVIFAEISIDGKETMDILQVSVCG